MFQIKEQDVELCIRDKATKKDNPMEDPLTMMVTIISIDIDSLKILIIIIIINRVTKSISKLRSIKMIFFRHQQILTNLIKIISFVKRIQYLLHPK